MREISTMQLIAAVLIMIFGGALSYFGISTSIKTEGDAAGWYGAFAAAALIGTFILVGNLLPNFSK